MHDGGFGDKNGTEIGQTGVRVSFWALGMGWFHVEKMGGSCGEFWYG